MWVFAWTTICPCSIVSRKTQTSIVPRVEFLFVCLLFVYFHDVLTCSWTQGFSGILTYLLPFGFLFSPFLLVHNSRKHWLSWTSGRIGRVDQGERFCSETEEWRQCHLLMFLHILAWGPFKSQTARQFKWSQLIEISEAKNQFLF